MSAETELQERLDRMKSEDGLLDMKFFPGDMRNATVEEFCAEANALLDLITQDDTEPHRFEDSRAK